MHIKKTAFFMGLLSCVFCFSPASALVVTMPDGRTVNGVVIENTETYYRVVTDRDGVLVVPKQTAAVPKAAVSNPAQPPKVASQPASPPASPPTYPEPQNSQGVSDPSGAVGLSPAGMVDGVTDFLEEWRYKGNLSAGFTRETGNADDEDYALNADTTWEWGKNRFKAKALYHYREEDDIREEDEQKFSLEYSRYLTQRLFADANYEYEADFESNLDARNSYGFGLGYDFWKKRAFTLRGVVGPNFTNEEYATGTEENYAAGRWQITASSKPLKDSDLELFAENEGLQSLEEGDDLTIDTVLGARTPFYGGFNLSVRLENEYDKTPPAGTENADTKFLIQVGYSFGNLE